MTSIWDDNDLSVSNDYITFDQPGDTVTGTITGIRKHTWADGSACPQISITVDGEEKTLTAGQIRLKALLGEKRPNVGDTITVTLTDVEKRAGGKTLKIFALDVNSAAPAAPAKPAPAAAPAAAAPAAPQNTGDLTDAQKEALKSLGL